MPYTSRRKPLSGSRGAELAGELRADLDRRATARLLTSLIQGSALPCCLTEHGFDLETEGGRVLDIALRGLVAERHSAAGAVSRR